MPMYEYRCEPCNAVTEVIRSIALRDESSACRLCGEPAERIISVPTMHVWNADRKFVQCGPADGGMSFGTKAEYNHYLAETNQREVSTDAPRKTNPAAKTIMTCRI
jgi:putative FmdB family regulatory protein